MPTLVLRAGRRRCLFAQYASAPALDHVITVDSPIVPTQNQFQIMLFGLARKLLRALLKAVWKGLKGAIGSLVDRINATGWRIRLDVKVHLNAANGSGDEIDRLFGPIRFELSRGVEAIPRVEGTDQFKDFRRELAVSHINTAAVSFPSSTVFQDGANSDHPALAASNTYNDNTLLWVVGETIERVLRPF
ncbi:hypothetical protein EDB83DRAFT_2519410 [Lactarius deliciosus]|nr:hypothetical protein EDB83DRAFT_2519410 [Lactarius deliciosus]